MVKITPEFKEKVKDEIKEPTNPERGNSRKLLETGGRKCVTLRPDWCRQWDLEAGSPVLLFIDENNKLVITPASDLWREEMEKFYTVIERKIVKVGNSLAVAVPSDILKEELGWETKKLLRSSDYATVYEPYDIGKSRKKEPEQTGIRRSTKIVALSLIVFGIAMGLLIFQTSPSGSSTLTFSGVNDWTTGDFNNTASAGDGLQLAPVFMENCEEGWTFTPNDNDYTAEGWKEWYTQGNGSVAIGSIYEGVWLRANSSVKAEKSLNLSEVDKLLLDVHCIRCVPQREFMTQEILINGDLKVQKKNKNFEKPGFAIDVENYENDSTFSIQIKNNSIHYWPSPTHAIDAIRSQKLKDTSGTYTSEWRDLEKNVLWENLIVEAFLENNTSASLTFQVSNNGESVQNSAEIELEDGNNNYDIPSLSGEYVRIKITMETEDLNTTPKITTVTASS